MAVRRREGFGAQVAALASILALSQLAPGVLLAASLAGLPASHLKPAALVTMTPVESAPAAVAFRRSRPASRGAVFRKLLAARDRSARAVEERPARAVMLAVLEPEQALEPPPARDLVPRYGPPPPPAPAPRQAAVAAPQLRIPPAVLQARATIVSIIEAAAAEFGQDKEALLRVAYCESRLNPSAIGPFGEIGIFQFMPRTFERNGRALGYTMANIRDVRAQARLAAYMWKQGQETQWVCR